MKNTDLIEYVVFTDGGKAESGKTMKSKMRFTNDRVRRTKSLRSMGITDFYWIKLQEPMTKVQAISFIRENEKTMLKNNAAFQQALNHAASIHSRQGI